MTTAPLPIELAVVIGRFQPWHNGHAALLRQALTCAPKVAIVIGSAHRARSAKNPFTFDERVAMISASLPEAACACVSFIPVRDYFDDERWSAHVQQAVEALVDEGAEIALVGHFKDDSSYYLNHFPQWQLVPVPREGLVDATALRRVLFEADHTSPALDALASDVPPAVLQYLKAWALLPHCARLAEEHAVILQTRAAWACTPYPPIFTTVDAVVQTAGHVLLIRRGAAPGKGLWALPGGYLEPNERLLQGALRELTEETALALLPTTLTEALVSVHVFDHPDRSQRGRTITHAHYFDLRLDHLPEVKGSDDAAEAQWVPVARLKQMEDQLYDDHFHILDHFLHLIPTR